MNLVIRNRSLFLVVWDTVNAAGITINPGQYKYRNATGAAIITLLPSTHEVNISIRNCWRRMHLTIPLKQVHLDKESFDWLSKDILLNTSIVIEDIQPKELTHIPFPLICKPTLATLNYQCHINPQFNYKTLYKYEP
jgi:hypothetical protein